MKPRRDLRILIVDDEEHIVSALTVLLESDFVVKGVDSAEAALKELDDFDPHVVLLDITLPGMDGLACLEQIKKKRPDTEVVMVTADRQVRTAVTALKLGAYDYLEKGFEEEDLRAVIRNVHEKIRLSSRVKNIGGELARPYALENIVGTSAPIRQVIHHIERVSSRNIPVLIQGETGTGKELIARAIHFNSERRYGPFVTCNCARLTGDLIESELFGHEKGAFTGAAAVHRGMFERANEGALFLDEIASMPIATQGKLLRVLEERSFTRLGGERQISSDFRMLAASNVDLGEEVEAGRFREDLYFRLKVYPITAPPLRAGRGEDIPPLIDHFIDRHRQNMQSALEGFTPEAMEVLKNHSWRGNVRELENTVLLLMSLSDKRILDVDDLDISVMPEKEDAGSGLRSQRASIEKDIVLRALEETDWNQTAAADKLRVHRNTLRNLMNRYHIKIRKTDVGT
jgi:two-component system response regulator AtoC